MRGKSCLWGDTVLSLAKAGCSRIAVVSRSDSSELQKDIEAAAKETNRPPPQFLALRLDLSSEEAVAHAAAQVGEKFESLDIDLVNNAGTSDPMGPFLDSNTEE
ncbi:hypothetical protein DTO027I6_6126 [Penicillium roqueforti]|nr:hypothetical protein DTO027I6_6126 [Penicillium roqueforti]